MAAAVQPPDKGWAMTKLVNYISQPAWQRSARDDDSLPATPWTPDAPEVVLDKTGKGSHATVYRKGVYVVERVDTIPLGAVSLHALCGYSHYILANIHATASEATRHLDYTTRSGGIVRSLDITGNMSQGSDAYTTTYTMPLFREGSLEKAIAARHLSDYNTRVSVANALLRTLVDMHGAHIHHGDIKPPNILVRQLSDGKTWQAAYTDFDTSSTEQWFGAPAPLAVYTSTTPGYRHTLSNPEGRHTFAMARGTARGTNPYTGECRSELNDAWALMCTLWDLFFGKQFMRVTHVQPTVWDDRMRGTAPEYRTLLNEAIRAIPVAGNETAIERIRNLFTYVVNQIAMPEMGVRMTAIGMLTAFAPPDVHTPVPVPLFVWKGPANPIAELPDERARRNFIAAVRDMLDSYKGEMRLTVTNTYDDARKHYAVPHVDPVEHMKSIWRFMTIVSTISHAISLVASYFVHNPMAEWPVPNSSLLHYIMHIAIVANIPSILFMLEYHYDEPIAQLYLLNCEQLGIVSSSAKRDRWQKKLMSDDRKGMFGIPWARAMKVITNNSKRWFGSNVLVPSSVCVVSWALRNYEPVWPLGPMYANYDPANMYLFYTLPMVKYMHALVCIENITSTIDMHVSVRAIPSTSATYAADVGRFIQLRLRAHEEPHAHAIPTSAPLARGGPSLPKTAPSLACIFSTVSA